MDTNEFLDNGGFDSDWFRSLSEADQDSHTLHYQNHVGACFRRNPFPRARLLMLGDDSDVAWSRIDMRAAVRTHATHAAAFRKFT